MLWSQLLVSCLLMASVHSRLQVPNITAFNWELQGCPLVAVDDQKDCNAGYAYAAAASIHLAYCAHTKNVTVPLRAKQIIKCSTSYGNHGCEGGSAVNAFKYVNASKGLNPAIYYLVDALSPPCSAVYFGALKITGFKHYLDVTEEFLIELLIKKGPLVVGIDASLPSFKAYVGIPIYSNPNCKSGLSDLNHDVLLTGAGHDILTGVPFFEFINSWGSTWGAAGRARILRGNNTCGIQTRVSHPEILE